MVPDREPGGYRSVFAALAGLAALLCAFGSGYVGGSLQYPDDHRQERYRYASDKPQEVDPTANEPPAEALEYREPCKEPKGRDESDLCAQWRAAKAGEQSALWAEWSFWVGCGGLLGLMLSLYYTREALKSAQDATKHAEESTNRMIMTDRAWLTPSSVKQTKITQGANKGVAFIVNWVNTGGTPAFLHEGLSCVDIIGAHNKVRFDVPAFDEAADTDSSAVGSQKEAGTPLSCVTFSDLMEVYKTKRLILYSRVTYKDIYDRWHTSEACFKAIPIHPVERLINLSDNEPIFMFEAFGSQNTAS